MPSSRVSSQTQESNLVTLAAPASQADSLSLSHQGSPGSAGEMILAIGTVPCHSNCKMILCLPLVSSLFPLTGAPGKMPLLSRIGKSSQTFILINFPEGN